MLLHQTVDGVEVAVKRLVVGELQFDLVQPVKVSLERGLQLAGVEQRLLQSPLSAADRADDRVNDGGSPYATLDKVPTTCNEFVDEFDNVFVDEFDDEFVDEFDNERIVDETR